MSGKPNHAGVKELSEWLRKLDDALRNAVRLEEEIAQRQKHLAGARAEAGVAKDEIEKLMKGMDVQAPGNFGYEGRMLWLLRELHKHSEEYGRRNQ